MGSPLFLLIEGYKNYVVDANIAIAVSLFNLQAYCYLNYESQFSSFS